jgi:hypothetical protein
MTRAFPRLLPTVSGRRARSQRRRVAPDRSRTTRTASRQQPGGLACMRQIAPR